MTIKSPAKPAPKVPPAPAEGKKTGKLTPLGHTTEGNYSASRDYAESAVKAVANADAGVDIRKAATTTVAEANALAAADRAARNRGPVMRKKYPFPT
jgi:hypothetical protein